MTTMKKVALLALLTVATVFLSSLLTSDATPGKPARAVGAEQQGGDQGPRPVEDDMHEFMEYVFQPTYRRLKASMADSSDEKPDWKAIKADSLILAEGGNLLLIRAPEEDAQEWRQTSAQVRQSGGQLYQAAKKKDFASARKHYEQMLKKCNSCHDTFAGGEHQLEP